MRRIRAWAMRVGGMFRRGRREAVRAAELESHLAMHIEEKVRAGMALEEARRDALIKLGGMEQTKEAYREQRGLPFIEALVADFRFGLRLLRKSPSFSIAVILTLALGIGANSAVFSAIDAVLLRPLPFPNADELMRLDQHNPKVKSGEVFVAPIRLEEWNRLNSTFQALSGYYLEDVSETSGVLPEKLTQALVAPRFLQV